jgi:glutamate-ammonia-ligase adenylyltransferase
VVDVANVSRPLGALSESFAARLREAPAAADARRAVQGRERWLAAAAGAAVGDEAEALARAPAVGALLDGVFGNSPFLTVLAEREPAFLVELLRRGPDAMRRRLWDGLAEIRRAAADGIDPGRALRIGKRRLALMTAVADLAGVWSLEDVTGSLSDFAAGALRCAVTFLLADAARRRLIALGRPAEPEEASGVIVLGMGKLGAAELNYSSDVDLIVLYDPERIRVDDPGSLQQHMIRLTRGLVRLMADRTGDGYVFRTDLRLRPDPASTPPAISVMGAEIYYETLGQNWERAALIKARPVAGDIEAGDGFLDRLRPFIWRKNLDFAAIQDIHSIKRQIHAHRGGAKIGLRGHNLKLGRGGIREIEFFVQTQQLIWGGRLPALRLRGTVAGLAALADAGKISRTTAEDLTPAYRFLRRLEHRLQMINDEQTHELPKDPIRFAALATFFGYADQAAFERDLLHAFQRVEAHYAELFEDAPALVVAGGRGGNLVFTGSEADPETLQSIARLGFANPGAVDAAVRGWHHGRSRAMRSARARELLTELIPALLKALSEKPDPDAALIAFDRFLTALPAGVQLFAMFHAQPQLLDLVTEILGRSPRLGAHLARRPSLLDSVLTADFFRPPPDRDRLVEELARSLAEASGTEDLLDRSRRWAADRKFQVGVQSLLGQLSTESAAIAWSDIADAAICALLPAVETEFATRHGRIHGCGMAVIALGKLGSREMTAASDLDLIFVYETPPEDAVSDGPRPLAAATYFARLSQRLINALTSPTAEGQLYAVDMRLRPSGKAGPIAVSFRSFRDYQLGQAWTWEQMALTRARVVTGPPALRQAIEDVMRHVLTRARDPVALVTDVAEMRARMAREHPAAGVWNVKHVRGGLIDVEFVAQYLQLRHSHDHPWILSTHTGEALARIEAVGLVGDGAVGDLRGALALWQAVQARLRLTLDDDVGTTEAPETSTALRRAMSGLDGLNFETLEMRMQETAARVRVIFARLIEEPAAAAVAGE